MHDPDFLIIGAAKSGTTSLFYYLKKHPAIFSPEIKELNYFSNGSGEHGALVRPGSGPGDRYATHWTYDASEYRAHFRGKREGQKAGEASVSYLYSPSAPARIRAALPDVKLIVLLRNPVERAWSHYWHMVRDGREEESFEGALDAEEARIAQGWEFSWHYKGLGLYGEQLQRYLDCFPAEQLRVYTYDSFREHPQKVVTDLLGWLDLDPAQLGPIDGSQKHNQSGKVRNRWLARLLNRPSRARSFVKSLLPPVFAHQTMEGLRWLNLHPEKPVMPEGARHELREFYRADIERLEEATSLSLQHWLAS
ncbi:MAG TPA: sulfotransferase [Trueperaceae bacterium]